MEKHSNDTQGNFAAAANDDTASELDTTTTIQFSTLSEPEVEISESVLMATEPEGTGTEPGVTPSDINVVGNSNSLTEEEGIAFANPVATAAKSKLTAFRTNTGPKTVPRAIKRLASFNKPGAKEVGVMTPLTEA